jgi:dihydropteroate synthase
MTMPTSTASRPNRAVRGLPELDRCAVVGVINVTPDSFSDGGQYFVAEAAVQRGLELLATGVDLIDVGGESTRPGAPRVGEQEELRRVLPVIAELAAAGATVSVDTMRAGVAERALAAGARVINDVSGGLADPAMFPLVAGAGVPYILMHWRGHSVDMLSKAKYDDVVAEVCAELGARLEVAAAAGIAPEQVIVDPGLGFAKVGNHDLTLLAHLDRLFAFGRPVLVAASRKSFIGRVLAAPDGTPRPSAGRDAATTAISAYAALAGAWGVRVHDATSSLDAVRMVRAIVAAR